jgi:hypothetical protein
MLKPRAPSHGEAHAEIRYFRMSPVHHCPPSFRMPRVCVAFVVIFLAAMRLARGAWDTPSWGRPVLETFRQQQTGNASNVYCATAQPSNGRLWFGTGKGLLSFDGRAWQNFSEVQAIISCSFEPEGRRLWYGGASDLGWFDLSPEGRIRFLSATSCHSSPKNSRPSATVSGLAPEHSLSPRIECYGGTERNSTSGTTQRPCGCFR